MWWDSRKILRGHHARLVRVLRLMEWEAHTHTLAVVTRETCGPCIADKWARDLERCPGVTRRHDLCGRASFFPRSCDFALCPWCQHRRADKARRKLGKAFGLLHEPKLITLNPPNVAEFTKGAVSALIKVFTGMRREKILQGVVGGVRSIETTWRGEKGWNLHLHALVDSPFIVKYQRWDIRHTAAGWVVVEKHSGLAREFTIACQKYEELNFKTLRPHLGEFDPDNPNHWYFVEVKRADEGAVAEVVKYIAKGSEITAGGGRAVGAFLSAIKGRRMIQSFGSLYDVDLEDDESDEWDSEADGNCPYEDCPAPHVSDWKFISFGPGNWVLDRDGRTGSYRLLELARDGPLQPDMYYEPVVVEWPTGRRVKDDSAG